MVLVRCSVRAGPTCMLSSHPSAAGRAQSPLLGSGASASSCHLRAVSTQSEIPQVLSGPWVRAGFFEEIPETQPTGSRQRQLTPLAPAAPAREGCLPHSGGRELTALGPECGASLQALAVWLRAACTVCGGGHCFCSLRSEEAQKKRTVPMH